MAQINWNNVAAPDLGESNNLFAQAIASLKDAGTGLKDTAKDYQTVVRNKSHAILQDYINSAKTPEELQSEAFNTGFKNLQATLANEYDAVKVNDYRDSAVDKLTKRAGDAVALEANKFTLSDGQRKAAQDIALAEAVGLDASGQLQGETLASYMAKVGGQGALELSKQRDARDVNSTNAEIKIRENQIKTMEEKRKEKEYQDGQPLRTLTNYVAGAQLNEIKGDNPQLRSPTYKSTVGTFGKNALANKESVLGQKVFNIAKENGVDGELLYTLASIESNWNPNATSEKGAQGLIQLMPQYNKERGVTNALDIDQNIKGASVYVKQLQKQFGDDQEKIVAAYNAGAGGVQKAIDAASEDGSDWRSKLPDETKTYLNRYKDLTTYLRTGNNGSDLKLPSGLKTDSYTQPSAATGKAKADHVLKMWGAVETANKGIEAAKLQQVLTADPTKTLSVWYKQAIDDGVDIDVDNIMNALKSRKDFNSMSEQEKVYIASTALGEKEDRGVLSTRSWGIGSSGDAEKAAFLVNQVADNRKKTQDDLFNTTLKPAYMEGIRAEAKKTGVGSLYEAAKNIDVDELSIYKLGIKSPVVDKAKVLYASLADKSQPEGAYIEEYLQNLSNSPDTSTAEAKSNVEKAGTSKVPVNTPTVKPPTIVNNLNPDGTVKGASLNGGSAWFQPKQPQTAPVVTATAKDVQNSTYMKSPLQAVSEAVTQRPTPLLPAENQNAFKSKANNLSIDTGTGKTTPAKNPVAMPDVTWGKPTQVVTMSPLVAKLPQYKAVATFVPDGDTFSAKSDSYATKGEKAKKAGGILCRVDSVDAPETDHLPYKRGQPYGEEAGKKLQQMILNKEISIRIVKPANGDPNEVGHYGRDICQIEVSGANVSTELIRSGAAWLYKEYNNYFTGLEAVEADAQANQRGLFGLPNPVYPPTAKHNGSLNLK